jgi:hypothetical protein
MELITNISQKTLIDSPSNYLEKLAFDKNKNHTYKHFYSKYRNEIDYIISEFSKIVCDIDIEKVHLNYNFNSKFVELSLFLFNTNIINIYVSISKSKSKTLLQIVNWNGKLLFWVVRKNINMINDVIKSTKWSPSLLWNIETILVREKFKYICYHLKKYNITHTVHSHTEGGVSIYIDNYAIKIRISDHDCNINNIKQITHCYNINNITNFDQFLEEIKQTVLH